MNNGMWTNGEVTCFQSPWQCRSITAEISAINTTPVAKSLIHTLASSLFAMDRLRIGKVRATCLYKVTIVVVFLNAFLEIIFNTTHLKSWHSFTIRQLGK